MCGLSDPYHGCGPTDCLDRNPLRFHTTCMRVSPIAYACFLLPCSVIAVCFLVSSFLGQIEICFPFYSGCVSISAAARQDPAIHIFRMVMLPVTTVLGAFWLMARAWLLRLGVSRGLANTAGGLGLLGAVFLVLYVVFLGTTGTVYELLRRFGTTLYFGGTGIAQLVLVLGLDKARGAGRAAFPRGLIRLLVTICVSMLIMGVVYIPAANLFRAHNVENIVEWNFAFLMHINFALVSILQRRQDLRLHLSTRHEQARA